MSNENEINKNQNCDDSTKVSANSCHRFGNLVLTEHTITKSYSKFGMQFFMQIFLKDISSIQLTYISHPIFTILALIALGFTIYNATLSYHEFETAIAGVLFLVFLGVFFSTRKHNLVITARGGEKMTEFVSASECAEKFINKITEKIENSL